MFIRAVALVAMSALAAGQSATRTLLPDPPQTCDSCAEWNQPREPFRIFGNTYYVGVAGLSSILITSDQGHVLIDGALQQSAPLIDANIRALGFKTEDIKLILNGHTHYDHAGGIHALQAFTGARVMTGVKNVAALQKGKPVPEDPQVAYDNSTFPAVANVHGVSDGDVLKVGSVSITAVATPGHTPGGTTWTWKSCEGSRCLNLVYADSISAVAGPGYKFTGDRTHPSIVDSFRRSITRMGELPCDIMIGAHPFVGDLDGKRKKQLADPNGPNPFVDPAACRALAADSMKGLDARIAEETGASKKQP